MLGFCSTVTRSQPATAQTMIIHAIALNVARAHTRQVLKPTDQQVCSKVAAQLVIMTSKGHDR